MEVRLISVTPDAEKITTYIARVSSPSNQDNPEYKKLLNFCIRNSHWSVFEHAHMTVEIETSLAIATQIIRHRSFTFQQFSMRYSDPLMGFESIEWRLQAEKNRQSSLDLANPELYTRLSEAWQDIQSQIQYLYKDAIKNGIARECIRFILPQCTTTKLYMTGNIRSWIHYLQLRTQENVQLEHQLLAKEIKKIFIQEFPIISQALEWTEKENRDA